MIEDRSLSCCVFLYFCQTRKKYSLPRPCSSNRNVSSERKCVRERIFFKLSFVIFVPMSAADMGSFAVCVPSSHANAGENVHFHLQTFPLFCRAYYVLGLVTVPNLSWFFYFIFGIFCVLGNGVRISPRDSSSDKCHSCCVCVCVARAIFPTP